MIKTYKKLFEILPDSDKWKFPLLVLLMVVGMVLEIIGIGMIPVFISAVADPDIVLNHEWLGWLASTIGINNSKDLLIYGGLGLISAFLIKGVYLLWFNYVKSNFVYNRFSIISSQLYKNYLTAPYTFHLKSNTADLIRNVSNETRYISNNVMLPSMNILMESITVTGIVILLFVSEPFVTLIASIAIGGGGALLLGIMKTKLQDLGQIAARERSRMIQGVNEGIGGFKDVTVMNRQKLFLDRFKMYVENLVSAEVFKDIAREASKPVIEFITVTGMIVIAFSMVYQGRAMTSIIPILTLFGAAIVRLMPAIKKIISELTKLKFYTYALNPVHDDIMNMDSNSNKSGKMNKKLTFKDKIAVQNVWYSYPNSQENVLKDISIIIRKSTAVGFVGPTGAGKSTIVDVILGLLEPSKGRVLVDGEDISGNKRSWQNNIGYIPQSIFLTDDTIRNNIAFGIPEEKISENKVRNAVEAAQLDTFIRDLPKGLDTVVGENGVRLSGGQRQRIGIARSLYDNPEVLIMDEGTSSLDNITEGKVISAIEALKGERTIIMIAHRLATVKNCDIIYYLENGSLVEKGTYNDLLEKSKQFRKMAST